ncbi:MAG: glycoside hydrolase family 57 protein [Alistipes sp.]|nr:glycoside hydrolase family 57 protein [Alistipes sp.]MBQ1957723.1 glycoside hydrolase family 57 protein [Alistipes sp.]MBQ1980033.1 glycoside hydrolase family 57 protein [Alistipes sp.]MBQ2415929.1 glycoside hydrolase family 57 protein [Alistipes sp.]MBQ5622971.1 glycoside hydrolase family 57 protein [Alistipes sp.]
MKTVNLYFQVHQPWRLKVYRFFNIGKDHNYLDDFTNRAIMQKVARQCYLPMNALLLKLIKENKGAFKCSFSITGSAVEQFRAYCPEVLDSFRALAETGCVEFLAETYSHSLASLSSKEDFVEQVKLHTKMIKDEFGKKPVAFRNTELIYSDQIGEMVSALGFKTILAEGAKHIMGWKSPNYIYTNAIDNRLKVLLRNYKLSDDIGFRFSNQGWDQYPLTAEKYAQWVAEDAGEVVNIFMDYETFGEHQKADTGIFDFMKALPKAILSHDLKFATVSETAKVSQPVGVLHCPHAMSWADEERDVTAWLGNELQNEAFAKLYGLKDKVKALKNADFEYVWNFMQTSDHFYYMATKWLSDGDVHSYFNPYGSSYEAFINYMNVLADFEIEVEKALAAKKSRKKEIA